MRLTIKAKLIIAFAFLITLSGIIFYLGNSNANELNNWTSVIIKTYAKRISLSGKIAEDVQLITKREKELVINTDVETLNDLVREIDTRFELMNTRYDELKEISDASYDESFADFDKKWADYLKVFSKVKTLAVTINTDSSNGQAYLLSKTSARTAAMSAIDVMAKIVKMNEKDLARIDTETTVLYENSQQNMLILLVISIIAAISISYWIIASIIKSLTQAKNAVKSVAEGDLTISIDSSSRDEIGDLLDYMKVMVDKLREVLTFVSTASDHIATASNQMSSTSQQMSQGSQEQAASAEEISASMEEMFSNIQQNTDNAQQTEKIALKAAEDIQEGNRSVNQTVESMKKIADKISIIGEIARQTNLLALNAAVEAARAGDHGKGFAVVAAEVRKLAERSQLAAAEINELSSSSVSIADKSGKVLEGIVPNIQSTARLVQEISAASVEQNSGAEQVNNAIQQFNQVIQQNAAASEEMATGSEELSSQADHLKDAISFFIINKNNARSNTSSVKSKTASTITSSIKKEVKSTPVKKGVTLDLHSNGGHTDHLDNGYEKY